MMSEDKLDITEYHEVVDELIECAMEWAYRRDDCGHESEEYARWKKFTNVERDNVLCMFKRASNREDALRAEIAELKAKQAQFWNAKKLRQDDACHWYVIPANEAREFDRMMDAQDWDGINETFGDFMQSGGVEELTFYIPEED